MRESSVHNNKPFTYSRNSTIKVDNTGIESEEQLTDEGLQKSQEHIDALSYWLSQKVFL
jgi:hypothetical protein